MMTMTTRNAPEPTVKAGEFKAKCLELMDRVAETGESLLITKRGRPVARLVPAVPPPTSLFGFAKGTFDIADDLLSPVDADWSVREERIALLRPELAQRPPKKTPARKKRSR